MRPGELQSLCLRAGLDAERHRLPSVQPSKPKRRKRLPEFFVSVQQCPAGRDISSGASSGGCKRCVLPADRELLPCLLLLRPLGSGGRRSARLTAQLHFAPEHADGGLAARRAGRRRQHCLSKISMWRLQKGRHSVFSQLSPNWIRGGSDVGFGGRGRAVLSQREAVDGTDREFAKVGASGENVSSAVPVQLPAGLAAG